MAIVRILCLVPALLGAPARSADLIVPGTDPDLLVIDVLSDPHCPGVCGTPPPRCPTAPSCPDSIACCDTFGAIVANQSLRTIPPDFTFINGDLVVTSDTERDPSMAAHFFRYWDLVPGAKALGLGNHEADGSPDSVGGVSWVDPENHYAPVNFLEPAYGCEGPPSADCRRWHSVFLGSPPRAVWLAVNNNSDDVTDERDYVWCTTPNDRLQHASSLQRQWLNEQIDSLPSTVEVVFVAGHRAYYGVEDFGHRSNLSRSRAWGPAPPETLRTGAVSFLRDLESIRERAPQVQRVFMVSGDQHCFSETVPIRHDARDDERGVVYVTLGISGGWIGRGLEFPALDKIPPGTLVHAFQDQWGSVRFTVQTDRVEMTVREAYSDSLLYSSVWLLGTPAVAIAEPGDADATPLLRAWPNPSTTGAFHLEFRPATPEEGMPLAEAGIFDAAGRRVRALEPASWSLGTYRFAWDGRDAAGASVASGRYFVRLRQSGRSAVTTALTILRQPR